MIAVLFIFGAGVAVGAAWQTQILQVIAKAKAAWNAALASLKK